MRRVFGLDQHLAGQVVATAAAAHLHELREQALRRAEVGGEQRSVGADHADKGQAREVVALGQHLCADQKVGLAGVDGGEQRLPLLRRAGGVAVDTQDACLGEALTQRCL